MAIVQKVFHEPRSVEAFSKEDVAQVVSALKQWFLKNARNVNLKTKVQMLGGRIRLEFVFTSEADLAHQFFKDGEIVFTPEINGASAKLFLHYHTGGTVYIGKFEVGRGEKGGWKVKKSEEKDTL